MKASELEDNKGFIVTPFAELNTALGGGIPLGKILEIAGSWSTGKSTLSYQIIGAAQKQGRDCLLLDVERAYTKEYGTSLGVDNAELDVFRAQTAEEYLDHVFDWINVDLDDYLPSSEEEVKPTKKKKNPRKGSLIVLDAIGALLPREESEKTAESRSIGLQARIIGSFCRKIVSVLDDTDTALLILNHTFIPIGLNSISSSGGKKLEFARSVWLILSGAYGQPIKKDATGLKTLIPMSLEIRKNKLVPNMGTKIHLDLVQGAGFVGDTVALPPPKQRGRKKKTQ